MTMSQEEYQFDEASVQAIMHWAETAQLPKEVVLSESEHIYDTSNPPYYSTIPSIAPKDLKTLNFMTDAGTINGEGKIILWGWKL